MRRGTKLVLAAVVVVLAAGGAAFWWYIRDDAPPPPSLPDAAESSAPDGTVVELEGIEGAWTVVGGQDPTFVGYRVDEVLVGVNKTAVGRTQAVTGTFVSGTVVESATFDADLTQLTSDESRRDNRLRTDGLQTDTFPAATFTLTEPVDLGAEPEVGVPFTVTAVGDLTLHGVTQPVSIELQGQLQQDGTVVVVGSHPVLFADYSIVKPDVAGFVTTEDNGAIELSLLLTRAP